MAEEFASLIVKADSTDLKLLSKRMKEVEGQSVKTEKSTNMLQSSLTSMLAVAGGAFTISKMVSGFKSLTDAGSDLYETINKGAVVIGSAFSMVEQFADGAAQSIGQSKREAIDAAATFGIFGKSAGLAGNDLGGFSVQFTKLASDLASFYNTSPQDAITAIGAAFRGEAEPIRRYGVLMDEASLKQIALRDGIISTTKGALTPQQKVLAAAKLIMEQTSDAQGDFARTSDGLANQQRILAAQIEDTKAAIGEELIPVMQQFYSLALQIATNQDLINFFKETAQGWAWIAGGAKKSNEELEKITSRNKEMQELISLMHDWQEIEKSQLALQSQGGSLFSSEKLEEAQNNIATLKEMVSGLSLTPKSASDGDSTGDGPGGGNDNSILDQLKIQKQYHELVTDWGEEAAKLAWEKRQQDISDEMQLIDDKLEMEKYYATESMAIETELSDLKKQLSDEEARLKSENAMMALYSTQFALDSIMGAYTAFGGEMNGFYKVLFGLSKSFAFAEAFVKLQEGLANSAAVGFPANIATIGAFIGQTGGILGSIASAKFAGAKDNGGTIPAGYWGIAQEIGPEIVRGPATVTSRNKTAQMFDELSNRPSGNTVNVNITLTGNYIGNNAALDDLARDISNRITEEQARTGAMA